MGCDFLFDSSSIHFHIDLFLHHSCEFWIADQLSNYFCNRTIQQFFIDLLFIITFMSTSHSTMFAAIVKEILVLCAI